MPEKDARVNVALYEEEHRILKSMSASVGLSQSEVMRLGWLFANKIALARIEQGEDEIELGEGIRVVFDSPRQARDVLVNIDAFTSRLRTLEMLIEGIAQATDGDLDHWQRRAKKLTRNGPWTDPRGTG
jgi:hypothetical protein